MATTLSRQQASGPNFDKRKGPTTAVGPALPSPLTEDVMAAALKELPDGTKRATEACLKCFRERKFTACDLLSYIQSVSSQSQTLSALSTLFAGHHARSSNSKVTVKSEAGVGQYCTVARVNLGKQAPTAQAIEDTRFEKTEEAVDMTAKLIERRRREVRRRQFSAYPGVQHQKIGNYMASIIRRLAEQIPTAGKSALCDAIKGYVGQASTPEQFVEALQAIVDQNGTTVTLEYSPEHETRAHQRQGNHSNKRGNAGQSQAAKKRARPEASSSCAIPAVDIPSSSSASASPYSSPSEPPAHWAVDMGLPDGPISSSELADTPLGTFLTRAARAESSAERNVTVKVVSQVVSHTGSGDNVHPYRTKSIFAFQHLDQNGEVVLLGMYVHEFGPEAPGQTAGRVLIECIDSIPIHGSETTEERQRILSAIVHGYMDYARNQGFSHLHYRVPPPSAENHHIFTTRSLSVRLEATVRMAHWYRRILEGALSKGIVHSFELQSHLSKIDNFPPSLLPSSDLAEEHSFSTMRSQLSRSIQGGQRQEADVKLFQKLISFKDRFCVATLHDPASGAPIMRLDGSPIMATQVSAKRLTFVLACKRENLAFGTLADAKMSTMLLLARMISDQRESGDYGAHAEVEAPEVLVNFTHESTAQGDASASEEETECDSVPMSHAPSWAGSSSFDKSKSFDAGDAGHGGFANSRGEFASVDLMRTDDMGGWQGVETCAEGAGENGGLDAELFADSLFDM